MTRMDHDIQDQQKSNWMTPSSCLTKSTTILLLHWPVLRRRFSGSFDLSYSGPAFVRALNERSSKIGIS